MFPKVSVVVPIYKVEKYISRCIESIINQSYTNLEIILVDDGSPDKCGDICEEYALQDSRIKVLHKENGGLSDARNFGMKYVSGEYTLFVDSDDWLELNMIGTMIKLINEHNSDIVQVGFYYAYNDYLLFDDRYYSENNNPVILDNYSLMKELVINEKVKNFAWGKLYKTDLIKNIPFRKDVLFEDVFWAHHVMKEVNKYVILTKPMYYYQQRSDSISSSYNLKNTDIIKGMLERHSFIQEYYKDLIYESYKLILKTSLIHYNILLTYKNKKKSKVYMEDIKKYINNNYVQLIKSVENDKELKIQLKIFRFAPQFNYLYTYMNKLLKRLNIVHSEKGLKRIEVE